MYSNEDIYTDAYGDEYQYKRVFFPGVSDSGEPLVQALLPGPRGGLEKLACRSKYHPQIEAFIRTLKPVAGKLYVLVNALGAGEYYGCNLNGDFFPEAEILRGDGFGFESYYKSGVYRNHNNARRGGKSFGKVSLAVYNDRMHRVELILELDRSTAKNLGHQDLVDKLDAGAHPPVSMGVLVPYDICSIKSCGRKAKRQSDRCDCIRNNLRGIDPHTGEQVCMVSVYMRHHDISFVVIPADHLGHTMEKIASLVSSGGLKEPSPLSKGAREFWAKNTQKVASIMKRIPALAQKLHLEKTDTLPLEGLKTLSREPLGATLGSATRSGMILKPLEFQTITLRILGKPRMAESMYRRGDVFSPSPGFARHPPFPSGVDRGTINRVLSGVMPSRSIVERHLLDRSSGGHRPAMMVIKIRRVKNTPTLEKVAQAYQGYRLQVFERFPEICSGSFSEEDMGYMLLGIYKEASASAVGYLTLAALYGAYEGSDSRPPEVTPYTRERSRLAANLCRSLSEDPSLSLPLL
jgi:hypothetical protein